MARVRSFLVDNTLGKVFTNVQGVASATAVNIIAGSKLLTKTVVSRGSVRVANNISNIGFYFQTDSVTTTAVISFTLAPTASLTKLRFKLGTTYATSTTIADNVTIAANVKTTSYNLNTNIPAGNYIFIDIISVGSTPAAAGTGLSIAINYYAT